MTSLPLAPGADSSFIPLPRVVPRAHNFGADGLHASSEQRSPSRFQGPGADLRLTWPSPPHLPAPDDLFSQPTKKRVDEFGHSLRITGKQAVGVVPIRDKTPKGVSHARSGLWMTCIDRCSHPTVSVWQLAFHLSAGSL